MNPTDPSGYSPQPPEQPWQGPYVPQRHDQAWPPPYAPQQPYSAVPYGWQQPSPQQFQFESALAITRRMIRSAERAKAFWILFIIVAVGFFLLGVVVTWVLSFLALLFFIGGILGYNSASRRVRAAQLEEAKIRSFGIWHR